MIVEPGEENERLDKLLVARYPDFSRTYFQTLIEKKLVLVNGENVKKREKLQVGDEIEIEFALTEELSLTPEYIPLDILYEDDLLLAINKPAGLVVHPGAGNSHHTFANALLYHCKQLPDSSLRPGIVHRLDKDTTGLLIAAKTLDMQQTLVQMFANRQIKKKYVAICVGNPGNREIRSFIGRHPKKRKEMAVVDTGGKEAITRIKTRSLHHELSIVDLFPETGRTHQLRVHLKSIGCPILGDPLYGSPSANAKYNIQRQLLHAEELAIPLPQPLTLRAPLPQEMLVYFPR